MNTVIPAVALLFASSSALACKCYSDSKDTDKAFEKYSNVALVETCSADMVIDKKTGYPRIHVKSKVLIDIKGVSGEKLDLDFGYPGSSCSTMTWLGEKYVVFFDNGGKPSFSRCSPHSRYQEISTPILKKLVDGKIKTIDKQKLSCLDNK